MSPAGGRLRRACLALVALGAPVYAAAQAVPGGAAVDPAVVDVRDFGARGDGASDDTAALASAVAAVNRLEAAGRSAVLRVPAGTYRARAVPQIDAVVHQAVSVVGDGNGASTLSLLTNAGGIRIVFHPAADRRGTPSGQGNISGVRVTHAASVRGASGDAFALIGVSEAEGGGVTGGVLDDLRCDPVASAFEACLRLQDVNDMHVGRIDYEGLPFGTGRMLDGTGVLLTSSPGSYSVDNVIDQLVMASGGFAGVRTIGHVEGTHVTNSTIFGAAYGLYFPEWNDGADGNLYGSVIGNHVNTFVRGVYVEGAVSWKIADNLFYFFSIGGRQWANLAVGATPPIDAIHNPADAGEIQWSPIDLGNPVTDQITGNDLDGFDASGNGIYLHVQAYGRQPRGACASNTITANSVVGIGGGAILVDDACKMTMVTGNVMTASTTYAFGPGALAVDNAWNGRLIDAAWHAGTFDVTGGIRATGAVTSRGFVASGNGVYLTEDAHGPAGYVAPDTAGGLLFQTLRTGVGVEYGAPPTVASALPACNAATRGHFATVTDSRRPDTGADLGTALSGGGRSYSVVNCDGSHWTLH